MTEVSAQELQKTQETVTQLRAQLKDISDKKEFWFQKKESLKKDIKEKVQQFRDYKEQCDKRNVDLKELKTQRDKHNHEVQDLISNIKKLNDEKYKALKKYNLKIDPAKLLEKINGLEKRVEIETNYEHERKLMDEIKKLKRAYDECAEVFALAEQSKQLDGKIKASRQKADEFHKKILELTKDTDYTLFLNLSKQITELKKTQEEAFQIFIEHKNNYLQTVEVFNGHAKIVRASRDKFQQDRNTRREVEHTRLKEIAKERSLEVEEKIKNKKRLTTEDILAFQGSEA